MPNANPILPHNYIFQVFGVPISLENTLMLLTIIVSFFGLIFIILQLRQIAIQSKFSIINERYKLIFDVQKFCFDNPEYTRYWIGGERLKILDQMDTFNDNAAFKPLMGKDLIMDTLEYLFLSGNFGSKAHEEQFFRRIIGNPTVREYMKSPLRADPERC